MSDALERAKEMLERAVIDGHHRAKRLKVSGGDSIFGIDELTALSQAAALISIGESLRALVECAHEATDADSDAIRTVVMR